MNINMPKNVELIIDKFYKNNNEAYIVGGCVRDSILGKIPKDYDLTTSALPDITVNLFEKTIPTGLKHGTVTVVINNENFEVTTFRCDGTYTDNRHPENVTFVSNIKDDLARRDFTVNAIAYNKTVGLVDFFNGLNDINNKIIKCVGDANIRFKEDALRMLRAIRFSCQLNFSIESKTYLAIIENSHLISNISNERIRDELCKILLSDNIVKGMELLASTGLLKFILPEIFQLIEYTPNCTNHNKDVFKHTLKVLSNTKNDLILRLSALFHDVGKLKTMTFLENGHCYFPKHSEASAEMTKDILSKLRFDNNTVSRVCSIINYHLVLDVNYLPTDGEIKRLINNVGKENIFILFNLQRADIKSLWDPEPFLRKVSFIEDRTKYILASNQPLTVKDLNINGSILLSHFNLKPGKLLGEIINFLLESTLDNPNLNTQTTLLKLAENFIKNFQK